MSFHSVVMVALPLLALVAIVALARRMSRNAAATALYERRSALLTPAERSFFGVLEQALAKQRRVFAQVRMADVLVPRVGVSRAARWRAFNAVAQKHIDFVVCDRDTLEIHCLVELDDGSHRSSDRRKRDAFLDRVCASARLPLLRFPASAGYSVRSVRAALAEVIAIDPPAANDEASPRTAPKAAGPARSLDTPTPESVATVSPAPACPTCGSDMVLRTAKTGVHAGASLWGCRRFPACRGIRPA